MSSIYRILATVLIWPLSAWLFESFDYLRGIPLASIDQRAEQAMIAWPMLVVGLLLGRSPDFWRILGAGTGAGVTMYGFACAGLVVVNPAMALLTMLGAGSVVAVVPAIENKLYPGG